PLCTGVGPASTFTASSFSRGVLAGAAATNWRTSLSLVPGTDVQGFSAPLSEGAGATPTNNRLIGSTATNLIYYTITDCPSGPVTYTTGTHVLGCGTYPGGTISGTTGTFAKFTGASAVGNATFLT